MSEGLVPSRLLSWDREFFRKRVAPFGGERLDCAQWTAVPAWCRREAIDCLYVVAPLDQAITRDITGEPGVVLADVRLTLAWQEGAGPVGRADEEAPIYVRLGRVEEPPSLRSIAALAHKRSRFYQAPGFAARAPALFERRIERSFEGFADMVWVADEDRIPIGYRWFSDQGITDVTVVTQASNLAAQRAYLRAGFLPRDIGCWFHGWRVP